MEAQRLYREARESSNGFIQQFTLDLTQDEPQRERMRDVEPVTVDDDAAIHVVLGHAGLVDIIGLEYHLAIRQFASQRVVGSHAILRQCPADQERRIPK